MMKDTPDRIFKSRDTDTNPIVYPADKYLQGHNIEIVGDGDFFSVQNINGSTFIKTLVSNTNAAVLKDIACKFRINGQQTDSILYFIAVPGTILKILAYATELDTVYELYEEAIDADYLTNERVIDAKVYPESGMDYVYFTDDYFEPRFIKCEIPSPYTANFLSSYDISLLRKGANGTITLDVISGTSSSPDGTLLSGTYQFAYRMCDPENKRFTKWSSLTNPIHVYTGNNGSSPVNSGIGLTTPRYIDMTVTPSPAETEFFSHYQIAVVENVGITPPTTASLLEIASFTGTSEDFEYKSNTRIGTIPISDITTPLAAIDTVKTLNVKENRLFGANVTYTELEFDNGTPTVGSGSITRITNNDADPYSDDEFASKYVGYWRDEVYRFGIVYYDENGNASPVQPLDLNAITGNQISGSLPDVKFPSRSTSNTYSIFNSDNEIQGLGLRLENITNHPTWARAFEIVRVKRKKNILFQTPVIPMVRVQGLGAVDNYPTIYWNGTDDITIANAQPQTSGTVLVPKNFLRPEMRDIVRHTTNITDVGADSDVIKAGEVYYNSIVRFGSAMIFPSGSIYNVDGTNGIEPFVFTGSETLDYIDYAVLKMNFLNESTSEDDLGDFINTNVSANFYALSDGDYYYDSAWSGKPAITAGQDLSIVDYQFFTNFGQSASVAGYSTLDYAALQTQGVSFGYQPSVLRCGVVKFGSDLVAEVNAGSRAFRNVTLNSYSAGGYVTSQNTIQYESDLTNNYVNNYSGYVDDTTYVGGIAIANVKLGLGDDRYGPINSFHEYISTGAKYTFSESEVSTLQSGGSVSVSISVYGGDCFIGPQTFKVCDSAYSIVNQPKNNGSSQDDSVLLDKWRVLYDNSSSAAMCIPVAVENCSQFIEVVLESEYSEVRDIDIVERSDSEDGIPIYNVDGKESMRTPLSYKYNPNLSRQNDNRVFVPKQTYSFTQNDFPARLVYSDLKIYNSDQAGFDIFRVGNFYDLEESRRDITKLAVAGDNLYAIQEQGVTYIPTGERQIEQTTGGSLAVRSGDVIGRPLTIDSVRGSQHLRGIVETGSVVYVPDNINKSVYVLTGQELKPIIENNETEFRSFFENRINGKDLISIYDYFRRELWVVNADTGIGQIFNERLGWIGTYDLPNFSGAASLNRKLYLVAKSSADLNVYTAYTGDPNQMFGVPTGPSITLLFNPEGSSVKTFDNLMYQASSALSTADYVTGGTMSQVVNNQSIDVNPRERTFRLATPRDQNKSRLRGVWLKVTLKWKGVKNAVSSIRVKYRLSDRFPW